jgi:membrane protein required for colicin V production
MNLLQPETKQKSVTYSYIYPLGPKTINAIGSIIPIFKNMFGQLQEFFGGVSQKITMH